MKSPKEMEVRPVNRKQALECYALWHYLKDKPMLASESWGAFFDGVLLGAISYGVPSGHSLAGYWTRETQAGWWEIKRLAMSPECPRNSESWFIGKTIKLLRAAHVVRGIVTYADTGQGHTGTIYKAAGFFNCGLTAKKKNATAFMVDGKVQRSGKTKGMPGRWVAIPRKWRFIKNL
jgi:hypothetical protein